MYGKIRISGNILVKTGMHIGGSGAFAAIGAVDSPIIRDARTNLPMIPGSSLKGKMRSLLAKEFNERVVEPNEDHERITRLFGSSKKGNIKRSRLLFSDMVLKNEEELRDAGLQSMTEVKFENSISRATAVANPRQIERAVRIRRRTGIFGGYGNSRRSNEVIAVRLSWRKWIQRIWKNPISGYLYRCSCRPC